jgi:hypothetical protein
VAISSFLVEVEKALPNEILYFVNRSNKKQLSFVLRENEFEFM